MRVTDILHSKKAVMSFEVFPPKSETVAPNIKKAVGEVADLIPDFMSVTFGAMGSTMGFVEDVYQTLEDKHIPTVAHLTSFGMNRASICAMLDVIRSHHIENILALRGDIPEGKYIETEMYHATDLIRYIALRTNACIGAACYPEGHPESESLYQDIENIKRKQDVGCEFLVTQMMFDNDGYYSYLEKLHAAGITIPVIPGVMPVVNPSSIKRIAKMSGTTFSRRFLRLMDRFGNDPKAIKDAGIIYATEQIMDLYANGIRAVHVYSMNKPDVAKAIQDNVRGVYEYLNR